MADDPVYNSDGVNVGDVIYFDESDLPRGSGIVTFSHLIARHDDGSLNLQRESYFSPDYGRHLSVAMIWSRNPAFFEGKFRPEPGNAYR